NRALPTLGFTHFQPAQLTTVGKRATCGFRRCWSCVGNDDPGAALGSTQHQKGTRRPWLPGVKGTTGTQASFWLCRWRPRQVEELDRRDQASGSNSLPCHWPNVLTEDRHRRTGAASIIGCHCTQDRDRFEAAGESQGRVLIHLARGIESIFGSDKKCRKLKNRSSPRRLGHLPWRTSVIPCVVNVQWFERTLDDSANRRVTLPEAFLTADIVLSTLRNVSEGLVVVYPNVIARRIAQELPFMATENLIMAIVKRGGDRQEAHEKIRVSEMVLSEAFADDAPSRIRNEPGGVVQNLGRENDLIERVRKDPYFDPIKDELDQFAGSKDVCRQAPEQVDRFLKEWVEPALTEEELQEALAKTDKVELNV
ncbi:hypothetical protein EDD16DRAFT_1528641, partial [Pisolithus croceorrhizus]